MDHLRRVVEQATDTVAAKVAHHAIAMRLRVALNGVGDIAHVRAGLGSSDAHHQAVIGHVDQPPRL